MSEATGNSNLSSKRAAVTGLLGVFASNSVAANLLMVLFLVGGLIAGLQLRSEVFPTIDENMIRVSVSYPGATPSEIAEGITRRVEEAVFGIEGVDRVLSTASEKQRRRQYRAQGIRRQSQESEMTSKAQSNGFHAFRQKMRNNRR